MNGHATVSIEGCMSDQLLQVASSGFGIDTVCSLFPDDKLCFFGESYSRILEITQKPVPQEVSTTVNTKIYEFIQWLNAIYLPMKRDGISKIVLLSVLEQSYQETLLLALWIANSYTFGETTAGVYIILATIQLITMQEMALVDPTVHDPLESIYLAEIQKTAEEHISVLETKYQNILKCRLESITPCTTNHTQISPDVQRFTVTWSDEFLNVVHETLTLKVKEEWSNGDYDRLLHRAEMTRREYITKISGEIGECLYYPDNVTLTWREMIETPLWRL